MGGRALGKRLSIILEGMAVCAMCKQALESARA